MGDRRISDLTAQTSFASGDCLAVDNSGNTESKKITAANAITTPINNVSQKVSGSTDAYSSSKAYSVGDLVIYNNTVYECTTACSAASWSVNQSNFTATTLSSKLTSLNQALTWKSLKKVYGGSGKTWGSILNEFHSIMSNIDGYNYLNCRLITCVSGSQRTLSPINHGDSIGTIFCMPNVSDYICQVYSSSTYQIGTTSYTNTAFTSTSDYIELVYFGK